MADKKVKKEEPVEVVEEVLVQQGDNITFHTDRWNGTSNTLVSDELPSLND